MLMRKYSTNKALLALLVAALLLLHWSATHIHLAGEHEHDGHQHHHGVTAHQHQFSNHHPDAIDIAADSFSHVDETKIVDLEHDCTQFHGKFNGKFSALASTTWEPAKRKDVARLWVTSFLPDNYQPFHQITNLHQRAPPRIS